MGEMRKREKAISPVISDILLAVIVVSIFAIIYSTSTNITDLITEYFWKSSERIIEELNVEEAYIKNGNKTVTLYIRNIGEITSIIKEIYWNDTKIEEITGNLTIKKGELTTIKLQLNNTPKSYRPQKLTITTHIGNKITFLLIADPR